MRNYILVLLSLLLVLFSCQDDSANRAAENQRAAKKKELIFANISKAWQFNTKATGQETQNLTNNWNEWRNLVTEMNQKPKSTMGAFQLKAKTLAEKAINLGNNVPYQLNNSSVESRIKVLTTKINELDLFLHLNDIPDAKVLAIIGQINNNIASFYAQIDEQFRKNKIQVEEGEQDMLRMMDPARAIPTPSQNPGQPNPQIDPAPRPFHVR